MTRAANSGLLEKTLAGCHTFEETRKVLAAI
jgi:hypothetical protein